MIKIESPKNMVDSSYLDSVRFINKNVKKSNLLKSSNFFLLIIFTKTFKEIFSVYYVDLNSERKKKKKNIIKYVGKTLVNLLDLSNMPNVH